MNYTPQYALASTVTTTVKWNGPQMLRHTLKGATNATATNIFYQYDAQSETFL